LAGCDNDNAADNNTTSNNDSTTNTPQQTQAPLSENTPTMIQENEYITFVRTISEVRVNEDFTVKVTVTAKQNFQLLAASDIVPEDILVVGGSTTSFIADAVPDQVMEFEYRARITRPGTFSIPGTARAKPPQQDSVALDLISTITAK
jgi:hypothetical protein